MNKLQIYAIIFIISLGGLIFILSMFMTDNINKQPKTIPTKPIVYTKSQFEVSETNKNSRLPYINLNSNDALLINQKLDSQYNMAESNKTYFDYEYRKSNNILSLLIKSNPILSGEYNKINYETFNFDLKNNELLSNNQIKERLNIKSYQLKNAFDNKLQSYYKEALLDNNQLTYNEYLNFINADYETFINSDIYLCKIKTACIYYAPFYDQITIEKHALDNIYEFQVNY